MSNDKEAHVADFIDILKFDKKLIVHSKKQMNTNFEYLTKSPFTLR